MCKNRFLNFGIVLLSCSLIVACSSLERKNAVLDSKLQGVQVEGMSNIRFVPSTDDGISAFLNELKIVAPKHAQNNNPPTYLSLSGGGDNGAFGAGLLSGWTKEGSRPVFDQVVGISTGSLIAPFAYLGSDYDYKIKEVFTTITPDDIYKVRRLISMLFGMSIGDNTPLFNLIRKTVDSDMLEKIAQAYENEGRLLLLGTTNIDSGQLVLWNMGKIASLRTPESALLFHRVMLASAAVPGFFPPELFESSLDGIDYHELHVDGGLSVQIYLYPAAAGKKAIETGILKPRARQAFIIRNAKISVEQGTTEVNSLSVLDKSYKKIIQSQGVGNLYQIYQIALRDKVSFNLAFIGDDFKQPHPAEFDRKYMQALFEYGYNKAVNGYPWAKSPPGYDQSTKEDIKALSQTGQPPVH